MVGARYVAPGTRHPERARERRGRSAITASDLVCPQMTQMTQRIPRGTFDPTLLRV